MSDATVPAAAPPPATAAARELERGLLRGLLWSGTAKWGGQLITWGSTLVIARLLTPEDYGVLGIALLFAGFFDLMTDLGFGSAVVQAPDLEQADLEATMGLTCLVGAAAGALVALGAPLWAGVYGDERLRPVVAVLALGVTLSGIGSVPSSVLQRRLAFDRVAKAQLLQGVTTALVTLALALFVRSYWALVVGLVAGRLVLTARVSVLAGVRPRWPAGNARVRELFRFGSLLAGDRFLWYFRANFDVAIIGAWLGQQALGLYMMANTLARMPIDKLGEVVSPVAFPVLSRARSEPAAMRRHYVALNVGMLSLALPATVGLMLTAPWLVPVLIGEQWTAAVGPLRMIALFTPLVLMWNLNHAALNALGHVGLNLRLTLITTLAIPPAMLLGSRWGVTGVAAASGLAYLPIAAFGVAVTWRHLGLRPGEFLLPLFPVLSSTAGMGAAVLGVTAVLPATWAPPAQLSAQILTGVAVYPAWAVLWHRRAMRSRWDGLRAAWSMRAPTGLEPSTT